jgi:glutamate N-acetyltransferase/amino-acid N-acetyltransferase
MPVRLKPAEKLLPVGGIRLAAVSAGIYARQRRDLALIEFPENSSVWSVFTRNAFCAAPVTLARRHLQLPGLRYCLINAGNANAGTGKNGIEAAMNTCRDLAALGGCSPENVLPFSTGVIGQDLPVDKIARALPELLADLSEDNWIKCAETIITTDTTTKGISRQLQISGKTVTVTGIAKGSGMIRPDMATMLAYIATDAAISRSCLQGLLTSAVDKSFNRICVDGDMSTNDACVLIATGYAGHETINSINDAGYRELQHAINEVCEFLAMAIVRDGEGATKLITIRVERGNDSDECLAVAYAVATSPLVKTAFFASDPNWGRIVAAVGRAGVSGLEPDRISVYLNDCQIVGQGGRAATYTEEAGQKVMNENEITLRIDLDRGKITETVWTCDFSYDYVKINADYRS